VGECEGHGLDERALWRFVEEQIYSLPGTSRHREVFSILLTGSRATGTHRPDSDVDVDVVCPKSVYDSVHGACLKAGIIRSESSFFKILRDEEWHRYFGRERGNPHFALTPLEEVERQLREYDDVWLWVWTNARVMGDPERQFQRIAEGFEGYPKEVLIGKIKYRWLLAGYWPIDVYALHHSREDELLPAATALVNGVNELLRVFFLVEGRPFPYPEKLMRFARETKLGAEFCPMLQQVVDLVVGRTGLDQDVWGRLDKAGELLVCSDLSPECRPVRRR
jgi:predicted nucleotidyltransferase